MKTAGCCFFDLFFTLIKPEYYPDMSENEVLGLGIGEWESYAEDKALYLKRAGGLVTEESKIIEDITRLLPMQVSPFQKNIFIGDGGSDELQGAKSAGMKTVFTEYLERKSEEERRTLMMDADWHITDIAELPGIVREKFQEI